VSNIPCTCCGHRYYMCRVLMIGRLRAAKSGMFLVSDHYLSTFLTGLNLKTMSINGHYLCMVIVL